MNEQNFVGIHLIGSSYLFYNHKTSVPVYSLFSDVGQAKSKKKRANNFVCADVGHSNRKQQCLQSASLFECPTSALTNCWLFYAPALGMPNIRKQSLNNNKVW